MRTEKTFLTKRMEYKTVFIDKEAMQREAVKSFNSGVMTEAFGKTLCDLINNITHSKRFEFAIFQEDMFDEFRQEVAVHCVDKFWRRFDPNRSTAFAFFTTVIMNRLRDLFRKLKHSDYLGEYRGILGDSSNHRFREKAVVVYIEEMGNDNKFK